MIAVSSFVMMAVCALLGFGLPVALAWWLVKKRHAKPETIVIGAGIFILFALVLESLVHQVVLKGPSGEAILGNIWYYALYGGSMAALFEEGGRFLAMKYLLKKETAGALPGIAYGIGHGGAEMLVLFGVGMISNIVLGVLINSGQADILLASAPAEAQEQVQAQFAQLQTLSAGSMLLGLWERISALVLQLGLSIIVWTAVRCGGKWLWLLAGAFLLHFLVDAIVVVLAKSADMVVVEVVVSALAIAIGTIGWKLAQSLKATAE